MSITRVLPALAALLAVVLLAPPPSSAAPAHARHKTHAVCAAPKKKHAACLAVVLVSSGAKPLVSAAPQGLSPADLAGAYSLPASGGAGRTVAVVDAYDDPNAAADLAVYRAKFGLPACGDGCFQVVGQGRSSKLPAPNTGWAEEESLDLDAVSAVCPSCNIDLVEANSSSLTDLLTAEVTAIHLPGVVAVSNSWGGTEPSNIATLADDFTAPGVMVTASSGDDGYGVEFPAASPNVVAVGGTSLTIGAGHTRAAETAWSGAGSGCARYALKPSWQRTSSCGRRAVADVAAVADPQTGLAVYDSYGQSTPGWMVVGGTSLSSPVIAAVHALSGSSHTNPGSLYASGAGVHDVTRGSNGSCDKKVLCTAGRGWDGPTGVDSPAGVTGW